MDLLAIYGVKFTERKQWTYDPELFRRSDTTTALKIHAEYIQRCGPPRTFFEVDRSVEKVDTLWHVSLDDRTVFSRELSVPAIVLSERPDWRLTKVGIVPQQKHKVWLSNLHLQAANWFPCRGDLMFHDGYRHMIVNVYLEPNAFWQQTNVWLGLVCDTVIPADGDARPVMNPAVAVPAERIQSSPLPEA